MIGEKILILQARTKNQQRTSSRANNHLVAKIHCIQFSVGCILYILFAFAFALLPRLVVDTMQVVQDLTYVGRGTAE